MTADPSLALVLSGGGARAAYQVGFLRYLAGRYPHFNPGILTGVSAGGIIATHLASRPAGVGESVTQLVDLWRDLRMEQVFRVKPRELTMRVARWGMRLVSGGTPGAPRARSLVDTDPLRELLTHALRPNPDGAITAVAKSLDEGRLCAEDAHGVELHHRPVNDLGTGTRRMRRQDVGAASTPGSAHAAASRTRDGFVGPTILLPRDRGRRRLVR